MRDTLAAIRLIFGISLRTDRRATLLTIVCKIGENASDATPALWTKFVIDAVVAGRAGAAVGWSVVLAGSWLVGALFRYTTFCVMGKLSNRIGQALEQEMLRIAGELPGIEHHERPDYLDRLQLLQADRPMLTGFCVTLVDYGGLAMRIAVTVALLISLHPLFLLMPFLAAVPVLAGGRAQKMHARAAEALAEPLRMLGHIVPLATTPEPAKEVRIFGLEGVLLAHQHRLQDHVRSEQIRVQWRSSLVSTAGSLTFTLAWLGAIAFVAWQVVNGRASAGDVILALMLAGQVTGLTGQTVAVVTTTMTATRAISRYRWLLDYGESARTEWSSEGRMPPDRLSHGIEFRAVSFEYPGMPEPVLTGVDLHIPAGSTIAIVGENGAGKSTLVKLLCGFYRVTSGAVTVDGVPLEQLDLVQWRQRLSAGFQDFAMLQLLAREAVGVGDLPRIDDSAAVMRALERASGADVVDHLVNGLETQLGRSWPGGAELSGGQWQKLALGRSMMREAPLLFVLDEPTSALDAHTEHALFERYAGAARDAATASGAITLLVSHRFSTVRMADMIVVIDGGRVVERGSHKELVARNGLYAELYELQASAYR